MSLVTISEPPTDEQSFFFWAQAHALHHYDCVRVAQTKFSNTTFSVYQLDPFDPRDMDNWLNQHQQMHLQMDAVLKVAPYDLLDLYWDDPASVSTWFDQNYDEHQQWGGQLNLG